MNLDLPADCSRRQTIRWLKRLICHTGPGFHLDTRPSDYVTPNGEPLFTPSECATLQHSLDHLFQRLGSERPYEIGAQFTAHLVCQSRGWKSPLEFHAPHFHQALLRTGTRDQLIAWLRWNDPHGCDTDRSLSLEDRSTLTLDEARALLRDQIERASSM